MGIKPKKPMSTPCAHDAVDDSGRRPLPADRPIEAGPALEVSRVHTLFGRPHPVQFRSQGALAAWTQAFRDTDIWDRWRDPVTSFRDIREEVFSQLVHMAKLNLFAEEETRSVKKDFQMLATDIGLNLRYFLHCGTVIESTPALETLLVNSDVDLSLPMSAVAPPYPALYLRFGEAAMRHLMPPATSTAGRVFDGVYCFLTQHRLHHAATASRWTLEFSFISKLGDQCHGHVSLLGTTDRGDTTVGEWLDDILDTYGEQRFEQLYQSMHAAMSYVVKVFLYMTLRQARITDRPDHDIALRRAPGLGKRKRAKLLRTAASRYDSILVGPAHMPASGTPGLPGSTVAPHWRRGHFRMQPCGPGSQQRRLIFVAPVLIHAAQLKGEVPAPKSYRTGVAA
jgi:hypothetical protein